MRTAAYIFVVICALLALVCYSLLVVASRADERAERMARKWIEEHREVVDSLIADTELADNVIADTISAENIIVEEMRDD